MEQKQVNCDYYEVHLVGENSKNLDSNIDYDALMESFPSEFGSIKSKHFGNGKANLRNITMGNYVLRLDKRILPWEIMF
ncbi:hypothetical protein JOC36_001038 [Weissella uvarum]|uniref:hypothetical protein n=1 Tax=Weissella uvarum TaxID=1479233 RepID=UPI00195F774F|nr:hypothetical protein [Weissella uvarum]MBM7617481.1 hypothetical protein [Weissella uvarum]MCM0595635.1 hypothetical protein [Weissella uvarum]